MSASTEKKLRQAAREAGTDKKMLAQQQEAAKQAKSRRRWTFGTIAVILLVAGILFLNSGFLFSHTTALTIGGQNYSPAEVNYQYANQYFTLINQYGSYASMLGLDSSAGVSALEDQPCPMLENGSWKDYFMDATKTSMIQIKAVKDYAAANGIVLTEEEKAAVDEEMATLDYYASLQGFSGADNFLAANYGNGVNRKIATQASYDASLVNRVAKEYTEALSYSADALKEKYDSYEGEKDYYEYAYYYIMAETVENEEGSRAATDETKAKAQSDADKVLAAYKALDTEDVEARLNEALTQAGLEAACTHTRSTGDSLGTYKEWIMSLPESGEASVIANSSGTGFYVVAFIGHNDNDYNLAQVRHILVKAVADENGAYTEEAKAEARSKAEALLKEWKSGEATEESFAQLANENSEDGGSNTNGGLYDKVMQGQMVEEFDRFCFEGHKSGDTAIVYGEVEGSYAGYHVMYFVGEGEYARDYIARVDMSTEDSQAWMEDLVSKYTAEEKFWLKLAA